MTCTCLCCLQAAELQAAGVDKVVAVTVDDPAAVERFVQQQGIKPGDKVSLVAMSVNDKQSLLVCHDHNADQVCALSIAQTCLVCTQPNHMGRHS